jgi:hypothetical protein
VAVPHGELRADNATFDFKNLSVRKIAPPAR